MPKRQRIKVKGKCRYVERDKKGRFKDNTNIRKSICADMRKKTRKKVKRGYGHLGDVKN
ncbi:MAG: hypothetical protein PHI88_01725 [Candidatus Pacebacteria bacterium]|nr:hypothetical protein [Candidatus Paceibacterota bacterium]